MGQKTAPPTLETMATAYMAAPADRRRAALRALSDEPTTPTTDPGLLLTESDVCGQLRISRVSAWRMRKNGVLHPVELPGLDVLRYRREDVERLATSGAGGGRAQ